MDDLCGDVCSEFIEKNKLTIKSSYYKRAADTGDGIFTFSVPLTPGNATLHTCTPTCITSHSLSLSCM